MKILIVGNEGYIGPLVIDRFKKYFSQDWIAGYDIGYFTHVITDHLLPRVKLMFNIEEMLKFPLEILRGI